MSQKIVTFCDAHQLHDEDVPGVSWEVTLRAPDASKATTWTVDLCEDDGKTLEDLETMLNAVGRVTDGPAKARRTAARASRTAAQARTAPEVRPSGSMVPEPCPVEGCGKVPATRNALHTHLRTDHGTTYAEATGEALPFTCPECGKRLSSPQGFGAHRRIAHGVRGARAEASEAAE